MSSKLGRNDPCHCGSGKKLKACHGKSSDKSFQLMVMGVIVVLLLFWFFFFESPSKETESAFLPTPFVPQKQVGTSTPSEAVPPTPFVPQKQVGTPAPSEAAPPGKIWSQEHGHWHDDPSVSPSLPNVQSVIEPKSQPPGIAPEGKVWSPEHNHWHNKQ